MTTQKDKPEIVVNRGISRVTAEQEGFRLLTEEELLLGVRAPEDIIARDNVGAGEADEDEIVAYPAYGARRHRGQELAIEFRLKNGASRAFSYGYLVETGFCPENGIMMLFASHRVLIEGRNLLTVFKPLLRHEVAYIHEKDAALDTGHKKEIFVRSIRVEELE